MQKCFEAIQNGGSDLLLNLCWPSANNMKFTEECVMRTEK